MKYFKCENCGSELTKKVDNTYACGYCKRTYYDDSLEKAYDRVYQNLQNTVQGIVSEELFKQKVEQIANCRQGLYKARSGAFIKSEEVLKWSEEILKLSPDDAQANFYSIAAKKRWRELNKFMQKIDAREVSYLVEGFVDYLTKDGQFAEECVLSLSDLIGRAFEVTSKDYADCHKKISKADEVSKSGIFDVELPRNVFVAYSSKDKERAYELVEYLEENGFTCFIAMRNLAKGVDAELKYNERLKKAIDSCQIFLFVSSKNSRTRNCDAYHIEMQYVKDCDIRSASNIATAKAQYDLYIEKNRNRCKPRLEYLIDEYGVSPYEKLVKQFFGGLTWHTTLDGVLNEVFNIIEGAELDETAEEKLARERAEFEAQKAELAKKEKELAKKQAEEVRKGKEEKLARERAEFEAQKAEMERAKLQAELELAKKESELEKLKKQEQVTKTTASSQNIPSGNIDDLYKAFKERERAEEEERKRREEEAKLLEVEKELRERAAKQGFEIDGNVLKKYVGSSNHVVIPSMVTAIATGAFTEQILKEVTIPSTVTEICQSAFTGCKNLKMVTIPASVTKIGHSPFFNCKALPEIKVHENNEHYKSVDGVLYTKNGELLVQYPLGKEAKEFTIPETVTKIGDYAFSRCENLTKLTLVKSVKEIGTSAFEKCASMYQNYGLTEIKNLSFVKVMNSNAFNGVSGLKLSVNLAKAPVGWAKDWNGDTPVIWERSSEAIEAKKKEQEKAKLEKQRKAEKERLERDFVIVKEGFYNKLVNYKGKEKHVVIPNFVESIGAGAFRANRTIETVKFTSNIYEIGKEAFENCTSLYEVTFDEQAKECCFIHEYAFKNCKQLVRLELPEKVLNIRTLTFDAFEGCRKLLEIYNRSGLTIDCGSREHGHVALYAKNIYTPTSGERKVFVENDYVLYKDGEQVILLSYLEKEKELVLPDGITEIYPFALEYRTGVTSVKLPNSLRKIGERAFACSSLTSVVIPGSVTTIESGAFEACVNLTQVEMLNSVTTVGSAAFYNCNSLTNVKLSESLTAIPPTMFYGCTSLTSVVIPASVTSIGVAAFAGCTSLTSLKIPSSVKTIEERAFQKCNKAKIAVDLLNAPSTWNSRWSDDVKSIEWKKTDAQLALEKRIREEKKLAKEGFEITNGELKKYTGAGGDVVIPDLVTSIGSRAFAGLKSLTSVTIPASVTSIGDSAFYDCSKLMSVYISDIVAWCNISFYDNYSNPLYYAKNLYLNNESIVELVIPDTVRRIKQFAFSGFTSLTDVVISNSVTSIEYQAFNNCSSLTSVAIGNSVTTIDYRAFNNCSSLTSVIIGNSVTTIGNNAFWNCSKLASVVIPNSVTYIASDAFYSCVNLKKVFLPKNLTKISSDAFKGCRNLTIYAETEKKPKDWVQPVLGLIGKENWNPDKRPVKWGATKEEFDKA